MVSVNVGEVYYILRKKGNAWHATLAVDELLKYPIDIVNADLTLTLEAAKIKSRFNLSYADAFAAALAIKTNAILVTNDPEFEPLVSIHNFRKTTLAALPF